MEDHILHFSAEFIKDFIAVLASNNVEGLFDIDTLGKDAWTEMTIGDASVAVPSNGSSVYDKDRFIPIAFAFDEDNPQYRVHCRCGSNRKHSSKPTG
ncbi:hypothetical protein IL306_012538 [Fusarium sp. DS 682]|nr:hypothetical protein IL306_012538 [Fusarium sp. DS 682]